MRFLRMTGALVAVTLVTGALTVAGLVYGPALLGQYQTEQIEPQAWPFAMAERTVPKPPDPLVRFSIVAAGDLMVHGPQLVSAKAGSSYDFTSCFEPVSPWISSADLAIANLETVLGGSARGFTGYPQFNSPDAFAEAAVAVGFDVLTTANNHTLDRGPGGLADTLDTLDALGALHTGSARTKDEADRVLVSDVRGASVAVLAYTYGMNGFTTPEGKPWMVNTINQKAMVADVQRARELGVDVVIVSIHNGVEYQRQPSPAQEAVERAMIEAGADVVLGSHPHVIQPMEIVQATSPDGSPRTAFIIHSLGNFVSNQRERFRDTGLLLQLEFEKNLRTNVTVLTGASYVPVWVDDRGADGKPLHRVLPIGEVLADPIYPGVTEAERVKLRQAWDDTTSHLGRIESDAPDPATVVFYRREP